MFDVGFAPVSVRIDVNSYDGDWRHVERFRNKSGWLIIADATLSSASDEWTTSIVAACDEWGQAVPTFMAPNLLGCVWGDAETCCEYPPDELDIALAVSKNDALSRWMRDSSQKMAQLADDTARRIGSLEAETARVVANGLNQIADLRRRRRLLTPGDSRRDILDAIILDIEKESDEALAELAQDRAAIRRWAANDERKLIERARGRIETHRVAYVHWHAVQEGCWVDEPTASPASDIAAWDARARFEISTQKTILRSTEHSAHLAREIRALERKHEKLHRQFQRIK